MSALYYGKIQPQAAVSDLSCQAGFPPSNVLLESLDRPMKTNLTGGNNLDITLASATNVAGVLFHDINFKLLANVYKSPDGVTFTLVGALNVVLDRNGRYRALLPINDPNVKVVRLTMGGVTLDGLSYYRVGAAYIFSSKFAFPTPPEYPFKVVTKIPQDVTVLKNGRMAVCSTGPKVDAFTLNIKRKSSQAYDTLVQKTSLGTCGLDLEMSNYPERIWPVRFVENQLEENLASFDRTDLPLPLTEVV